MKKRKHIKNRYAVLVLQQLEKIKFTSKGQSPWSLKQGLLNEVMIGLVLRGRKLPDILENYGR